MFGSLLMVAHLAVAGDFFTIDWFGGHNTTNVRETDYATMKALMTQDSLYGSVDNGSGTFITNNFNIDNTTAFTEGTVNNDCTFYWTVSSEAAYDLFYLWINESFIGQYHGEDSGNIAVSNGDKISVLYSKDGSAYSGDDEVTFTFS